MALRDNYFGKFDYSASSSPASNPTKSTGSSDYGGLLAGLSLFGSINQAEGQKALGKYQETIAQINKRMADRQASESLKRGQENLDLLNRKTSNLAGSQRASFAAQGVQVDAGSAAEVQADTFAMGSLDAVTVRNNSYREAFGYKVQGIESRLQGSMQRQGTKMEVANTLMTGGLRAASYYNK